MEIKPGIKLVSESEGTGTPVQTGDKVRVRLNGWLSRGDAIQRDHVAEIIVGRRAVIPGIEYSLIGMKCGGKRRVRISPHLGYRDVGVPDRIPANALLIYEIEVLEVEGA
jgi:FKBP-type peptidyl-prolyl cis-trans isomerase